jgi:hypothetical protein
MQMRVQVAIGILMSSETLDENGTSASTLWRSAARRHGG